MGVALSRLIHKLTPERLSSRLTVLYAGLFGVTLLLIFAASLIATTRSAERQVAGELAAGGAVFERILALRTGELENAAELLSRDFGFRAAVATEDAPTVASALENLRARLDVDLAFVIGLDGQLTVGDGATLGGVPPETAAAIRDADGELSGLLTLDGVGWFGVSTPIEAPERVGWLVFANRIDAETLAGLQSLTALPLQAAVLMDDTVVSAGGRASADDLRSWRAQAEGETAVMTDGAATRLEPLRTLNGRESAVLLLRYPLSAALAPYRPLLGVVLGLGLIGLAVAVLGSWALARSVSRPIQALERAAGRLREGREASVAVEGAVEVASLARSFNAMATSIRERETALADARDTAESANRAKDVFLANMSHELRTPLNGVLGLAGVLSGTPLDAKQREMVSMMEDSAGALRDVLGSVLDLTSLLSGRLVLEPAPFDLTALLHRLAAETRGGAAEKGLAFNADVSIQPRTGVCGDERRVRTILEAVLSNALKFTDRGSVSLTAGYDPAGECRIEVRDTGVGFDPADAEALFAPFRQADGSSTRRFGGAGLGLSLARELAQAMHGSIVADGAPGRGASFTVTLPLPPATLASDAVAVVDAEHHVMRVLVADDHQTNRKVVELILGAVGVETVAVENGAEALAAYDADPFDAVLMDIQMPVMDGLTAIRGIRAREAAAHVARVPIVVLSANALPAHHAESLAAGADDHVDKPITAPRLIAALERAMARQDRMAA